MRPCTRAGASRNEWLVTYNGAKKWLEKIGGRTVEAKDRIRVTVTSARGPIVEEEARFDGALEGYQREVAVRSAFVHACSALKDALR